MNRPKETPAERQAHFRYERKQRIVGHEPALVEHLLRNLPAHLLPLYQPRYVNNVYWDTCRGTYLADHIDGAPERKKVRIRWYGDLNGTHPAQLEIKRKTGWLISKQVHPVGDVSLDTLLNANTRRMFLGQAEVPQSAGELLAALEPVLVNRYRRSYWCTQDRRVRLTVDSQMTYYRAQPTQWTHARGYEDCSVVLELKYGAPSAAQGAAVSNQLPFSLEKNSKYVIGVGLLSRIP